MNRIVIFFLVLFIAPSWVCGQVNDYAVRTATHSSNKGLFNFSNGDVLIVSVDVSPMGFGAEVLVMTRLAADGTELWQHIYEDIIGEAFRINGFYEIGADAFLLGINYEGCDFGAFRPQYYRFGKMGDLQKRLSLSTGAGFNTYYPNILTLTANNELVFYRDRAILMVDTAGNTLRSLDLDFGWQIRQLRGLLVSEDKIYISYQTELDSNAPVLAKELDFEGNVLREIEEGYAVKERFYHPIDDRILIWHVKADGESYLSILDADFDVVVEKLVSIVRRVEISEEGIYYRTYDDRTEYYSWDLDFIQAVNHDLPFYINDVNMKTGKVQYLGNQDYVVTYMEIPVEESELLKDIDISVKGVTASEIVEEKIVEDAYCKSSNVLYEDLAVWVKNEGTEVLQRFDVSISQSQGCAYICFFDVVSYEVFEDVNLAPGDSLLVNLAPFYLNGIAVPDSVCVTVGQPNRKVDKAFEDNRICSKLSNVMTSVMEEKTATWDVRMATNPVLSDLLLLFTEEEVFDIDWEIYTPTGQRLKAGSHLTNTPLEIAVADFSSGLYFIRMKRAGVLKTLKWVKD